MKTGGASLPQHQLGVAPSPPPGAYLHITGFSNTAARCDFFALIVNRIQRSRCSSIFVFSFFFAISRALAPFATEQDSEKLACAIIAIGSRGLELSATISERVTAHPLEVPATGKYWEEFPCWCNNNNDKAEIQPR